MSQGEMPHSATRRMKVSIRGALKTNGFPQCLSFSFLISSVGHTVTYVVPYN